MQQKTEQIKMRRRFRKAAAMAVFLAAAFCWLCPPEISVSFAAEDSPPRVIAHAGGSVMGYGATDSLEAVSQSIEAGYTLIELDFLMTSDGRIAVVHDFGPNWTERYLGIRFDGRPTEEEFLNQKILGRFTPMSFGMLAELLEEHPEVRIVTDCKEDSVELLWQIAHQYPEFVDRIVPQIYYYYQYEKVKDMGYGDIILTLYSMNQWNLEELLDFAESHPLFAVTAGFGTEHERIGYRLAEEGFRVYLHPVNDFEEADRLLRNGIYGVYSSVLAPDELTADERSLYLLDPKSGKRLQDSTLEGGDVRALWTLPVQNRSGAQVQYLLDGLPISPAQLRPCDAGVHTLTLRSSGAQEFETDYALYKSEAGERAGYLRITEQKNAYRLKRLRRYPELSGKLASCRDLTGAGRSILSESLILAVGESGYYDSGVLKQFRFSVYDLDAPVWDRSGNVTVPEGLAGQLNGRDCIRYKETLVFLPRGVTLSDSEKMRLAKAAKYIFYDWNRAKEEIYAACI